MTAVFADTSFYLALLNKRDKWHDQATELFRQIESPIVTTEYVLLELGALMSRGSARPAFVQFVKVIEADPQTELISSTPELFKAGLELFSDRMDKEWSLTDCTSFCVMRDDGVNEALTCDRHFEQAGFRALLV